MYCFFYLDDNGTVTWSRYLLFAYKSENCPYRLTWIILHCFVFPHMHLQAHHCRYYSLWIFGFPLKVLKTRLLGRYFHARINNISFYSPIDVGSHNPPSLRPSILAGMPPRVHLPLGPSILVGTPLGVHPPSGLSVLTDTTLNVWL